MYHKIHSCTSLPYFLLADGARQVKLSTNDGGSVEKEMLCSTQLKRASSSQSARTDWTATIRIMIIIVITKNGYI